MGDLFGGGQADAAESAARQSAEATKYASDIQMQQFQQLQKNLAPYMGAGQTGLMALMGMLGLPGAGVSAGGGMSAAQLREQLLPQFTSGGAGGRPPSLAELGYAKGLGLATPAARQNANGNAIWTYDPGRGEWGYKIPGAGEGLDWIGAPNWSGGQVDEAGLQAAIQQRLAQQSGTDNQAYGAFAGLGKLLSTPFSFDASDLENTPGYQFTMNQGLKSLSNQNAAKGLGLSGAQQKGALEYATGLADNTYGQQYNRALQGYMTNYGMASDMFNRLSGLAGMGQNSAAGVGNAGMQTASALGNLAMQNAQNSGQAGMAAAQANQGILPNLLNAGMAGAGIYALLSDRRYKTDIEQIGVTPGGHRWYRYRYVGRPGLHEGVMAQEVERTVPEAVIDVDGVKYVDYSRVE